MKRRTVLTGGAALAAGLASGGPAFAGSKPRSGTRDIAYQSWTGTELGAGTTAGTAVENGALVLTEPIGTIDYTDPYGSTAGYEYGQWTSPSVDPGFGLTELISSWNATTPGGSWLQVEMHGPNTGWYVLGRWCADDTALHRTSVGNQADATGTVQVDTFVAASGVTLASWQLRLTLYRPAGSTDAPALRSIGAVASALPSSKPTASAPGAAAGTVLDVPQYSQEIHSGQYPQWDGGGEAWCSPTSTSMVVAYWGTGPTADDYAWVDPSYADPWVDHAARNVYDYRYTGCGNWPFNTAYAARFGGLSGFVTRLRSLAEAELFIQAGIPLVLSASFKKGEIPGLDYGTNGHLMVLAGFAADGSPVLNDPYSADDASVRKAVGRAELESAWLTSSGGTTYVVHDPGTPLPLPPGQPNW
ncbi:membrane protein [Actinocatenispora thailandica]|uniref:Membrane protein n=1 Tax=Actinocatenispora thailandica TaxID=227318 RepID=A0A7R7DKN0_9ACTN|nr:C39 family peptidase [Actinocatenispora thailandica]BCJ33358.1 membrane protein [Actinocatenispora thailandica]